MVAFEAVTLGQLAVDPKNDTMTIPFKAEDGSTCEVKLPREILQTALPKLSRVIQQEARRRVAGGPLQQHGDLEEVVLQSPKTIYVDVSALSDKVVLDFDIGLEMETRYGLAPDDAIQLGTGLVKAGQHCKASSSGTPSA